MVAMSDTVDCDSKAFCCFGRGRGFRDFSDFVELAKEGGGGIEAGRKADA